MKLLFFFILSDSDLDLTVHKGNFKVPLLISYLYTKSYRKILILTEIINRFLDYLVTVTLTPNTIPMYVSSVKDTTSIHKCIHNRNSIEL